MIKFSRTKELVNKTVPVPDMASARVQTFHASYVGKLSWMPAGSTGTIPGYLLANDNTFLRVDSSSVNNSPRHENYPKVQVNLKIENRDWIWYDCIWEDGRLFAQYREHDFVDSHKPVAIGDEFAVDYLGISEDERDEVVAKVVLVRDNALVVEVEFNNDLAVFEGGQDSTCGMYRLYETLLAK
ncbi:hypothetical protein NVP1081O_202 [Vibrio phage 1.081.O._10N.286.52.C2]|nr:hypothetical protein NVP1081O_202 [Vibrio phage 1.081.O._10N.286.52.C2]